MFGGKTMFVFLSQAVGKNAPNRSADVKVVHQILMDIGKIRCYPCSGTMDGEIMSGIEAVQRHFMLRPDSVIGVNGATHRYLSTWEKKRTSAGVLLPGRLREAWEWVNPLLPKGSYCSSGFRSAADQRRILHKFFSSTYKTQIIKKYSENTYKEVASDLTANEQKVLEMVRGVGQAIAAPGSSMHQKGKAIDIGGPTDIDKQQVAIVRTVAKAHPDLFSGKVLKERNGCVHFEIR
jgi:hypothetical protein